MRSEAAATVPFVIDRQPAGSIQGGASSLLFNDLGGHGGDHAPVSKAKTAWKMNESNMCSYDSREIVDIGFIQNNKRQ